VMLTRSVVLRFGSVGGHPELASRQHPGRGTTLKIHDGRDNLQPQPSAKTAIYARVSSADQKSDPDRQVAKLTAWATSNGCSVGSVVSEVGPALNGKRRKFLGLLRGPMVTTIIVEHRDRFARFGAEYLAGALGAGHRRMVTVDEAEVDDDLVRDMTGLMTSLCARLCARRSAVSKPAQTRTTAGLERSWRCGS